MVLTRRLLSSFITSSIYRKCCLGPERQKPYPLPLKTRILQQSKLVGLVVGFSYMLAPHSPCGQCRSIPLSPRSKERASVRWAVTVWTYALPSKRLSRAALTTGASLRLVKICVPLECQDRHPDITISAWCHSFLTHGLSGLLSS